MKAYLHTKPKPTPKHHYAYDVVFDGDLIVTDSRDPEHDLARALLARGIIGSVTLHDGKTGKARTRVNIERAATRGADSNGKGYTWRPYTMRESVAVRGYSHEDAFQPCQPRQTRLRDGTAGGLIK